MLISPQHVEQSESPLCKRQKLSVSLASGTSEIDECLALRYDVFAREMGANLSSHREGLDEDHFDAYAKHLLIRDTESGAIVATTRLLNARHATAAGSFYSETEFNISNILSMRANLMEVGRTCIAEPYRNGAALSLLWRGIVRITAMDNIDYLIGCVSLPCADDSAYANAIMNYMRQHHYADDTFRVYPLHELPAGKTVSPEDVILPTLLKGYIRLGALACGEPCYDADFQVADIFIAVPRDEIDKRFARHMA